MVEDREREIGYRGCEMEILREDLGYIDYGVDYCEGRDNYGEGGKFGWSCEI